MKRNRILPDHVTAFVDRHGKERFRYRRAGYRTVCLPPPGSADFAKAYEAAKLGIVVGASRARPQSIGDLFPRLYATNAFKRSGDDRQRAAKAILEPIREEFGDLLVRAFKWNHIEKMLADRAVKRLNEKGRPVGGTAASNNLRKELNRAFDLAVKLEWIRSNPVDHAESVAHTVVGHHNWTDDEVDQYRDRHPVGTMARAALEIMLWTAQRGGDAHRFGPQHMKGDKIEFAPAKQKRKGVVQYFDAAPALLEAVRALPTIGTMAFLLTSFGKPFASPKAFQNRVRKWCDEAELFHCSAHGLRKAAARRVAENGGTQQEIKAVGGWSTDKAAAPYIAAADKAKLSKSGTAKVIQFEADRAANG